MPGNAGGHSWGCLQGEGEGLSITGVSLDCTAQVSGGLATAFTVSWFLCLSRDGFPRKCVLNIANEWLNPRCAAGAESVSGSRLTEWRAWEALLCKSWWARPLEHIPGENQMGVLFLWEQRRVSARWCQMCHVPPKRWRTQALPSVQSSAAFSGCGKLLE